MDAPKVRLLLVGGFLGAGKTTLLWEAAKRLTAQGKRVGLITNDQAPDLVDTHFLMEKGLSVEEVAGSCFCCNFQGLIDAAGKLSGEVKADVLIAEPVGSCTDLSATILQPLKDRFSNEFTLSPLTVLCDPFRLEAALKDGGGIMHPSAAYILRKQLEEADEIIVSKSDLLSSEARASIRALLQEAYPEQPIRFLSTENGEGVEPWLTTLMSAEGGGRRIARVDYDRYAEGEATLGWLNAEFLLEALAEGANPDWEATIQDLLESLKATLYEQNSAVGHMKMHLSTDKGSCIANLTQLDRPVSFRGHVEGQPRSARLIVNARVEMAPEALEQVVDEALSKVAGNSFAIRALDIRRLVPGRPEPTFRYARVVS